MQVGTSSAAPAHQCDLAVRSESLVHQVVLEAVGRLHADVVQHVVGQLKNLVGRPGNELARLGGAGVGALAAAVAHVGDVRVALLAVVLPVHHDGVQRATLGARAAAQT